MLQYTVLIMLWILLISRSKGHDSTYAACHLAYADTELFWTLSHSYIKMPSQEKNGI